MGKSWSDPGCSGLAVQGWAGKAPTGALMRSTEPRNDKPPMTGVDAAGGLPYALSVAERSGRLRGESLTCQPLRMVFLTMRRHYAFLYTPSR
jgi:hypothetical protein